MQTACITTTNLENHFVMTKRQQQLQRPRLQQLRLPLQPQNQQLQQQLSQQQPPHLVAPLKIIVRKRVLEISCIPTLVISGANVGIVDWQNIAPHVTPVVLALSGMTKLAIVTGTPVWQNVTPACAKRRQDKS